MKNLGYIATIALMASGMALAQNSGSQGTMDSQIGSSTASAPHTEASPKPDTPAAMGAPTPTTPDEGAAPKGETPATGVQSSPQQGSPVDNSSRPDMNSGAAPTTDNSADAAAKGSDPNSTNAPKYAKPITSSEGSDTSSTPSQKSTDTGTASPK